jgi:hypothetical protein
MIIIQYHLHHLLNYSIIFFFIFMAFYINQQINIVLIVGLFKHFLNRIDFTILNITIIY